jgi:hypothetical protein
VALFQLNLQAIPEIQQTNQGAFLEYSIASTQPDCLLYPARSCDTQRYEYTLYACGPSLSCPTLTGAFHPMTRVCHQHSAIGLSDCNTHRYFCYITNGPPNPDEDAFIEWFWSKTNLVAQYGIVGKFTWMASKNWIINCHQQNGGVYTGGLAFPYGIPLWNPSNHNPG